MQLPISNIHANMNDNLRNCTMRLLEIIITLLATLSITHAKLALISASIEIIQLTYSMLSMDIEQARALLRENLPRFGWWDIFTIGCFLVILYFLRYGSWIGEYFNERRRIAQSQTRASDVELAILPSAPTSDPVD